MPLLIGAVVVLGAVSAGWLWWFVRHGRPQSPRPPVLLYHKVTPRFDLSGTWTTPAQFEAHLRSLKGRGFRAMTLSEFHRLLEAGSPFPEKRVVITFDDAYETVLRYAFPLLREYGFTATIFAVTGFIGCTNVWDVGVPGLRSRHLGWDELAEMAAGGCSIGSHTVTHIDLTKAPADRVRTELVGSKHVLEERLGVRVDFLSYPFGRYDDRTIRLAREAGYRGAVSSYPRGKNWRDDPFALRRMGIYIIDTMADFRIKTDERPRLLLFGLEELKGRVINFCSRGTSLVKPNPSSVDPRVRAGGGVES